MGRAPTQTTVVEAETTVDLIGDPDQPVVPVGVGFRYSSDDPLAMCMLIRTNGGANPIEWVFGRDLLAAGMNGSSGLADVNVHPASGPRGEFLHIRLSSPDGTATFEVRRMVVARFLRRAYQVVPRGREQIEPALDAFLTRLLSGR